MPKFQYSEISNIYVQCMADPSNCADPPPDRRMAVEICFYGLSMQMCIGPIEMPHMSEIVEWFLSEIFKPIERWFKSLFGFEEEKVEEPTGVKTKTAAQTYDQAEDVETTTKDGETVPKKDAYKYEEENDGDVQLQSGVEGTEEDVKSPDGVNEPVEEDGVVEVKQDVADELPNPNPNRGEAGRGG